MSRPSPAHPAWETRRPPSLVGRRLRDALRALLVLGVLMLAYGALIGSARFRLHRETLALPGWPAALDGLTVAALGDIHGGAPHITREALDRVVAQTNGAHPDVVVLLGDYVIHEVVGGRFMPPEEVAEALSALHAPLGVVAVLGNHDGWLDAPRVRRALESRGIPVLVNRSVRVERGGAAFWIAGLADLWTGQADIPVALDGIPAGEPILLLEHSPDIFPAVPARVTLTLAAHTHGGQVWLPLLGAPLVPSEYHQRYVAGHVVEGGRHLYVTTGLGTSILPVRLNVVPEVALLQLRHAP